MSTQNILKTKIFADGAQIDAIKSLAKNSLVKGFTTNPTLMRKAGVVDYEKFCREVLEVVPSYPVSFEVFSDDLKEMRLQARKLASWGKNVYVKIPITNTKGESTGGIIKDLTKDGIQVNVTAIFTIKQVAELLPNIYSGTSAYVSVFAGRIADTGLDPVPVMREVVSMLAPFEKTELIWASPRELLNIIQASDIGCDIITVTPDLLKKVVLFGKDLDKFSLETVEMFYKDAQAAQFSLAVEEEVIL